MDKKVNYNIFKNIQIYNTPLEFGLRSLFILNKLRPKKSDVQKLISLDYLLIHSNDVKNGPKSIHPPLPHRSIEFIIKREFFKRGLLLMQCKKLIDITFDTEGIQYSANNLTEQFINAFDSRYALILKERSEWVITNFGAKDGKQLTNFINDNMEVWGGEFTKESLFGHFNYE